MIAQFSPQMNEQRNFVVDGRLILIHVGKGSFGRSGSGHRCEKDIDRNMARIMQCTKIPNQHGQGS
jgi:hypothetical protein